MLSVEMVLLHPLCAIVLAEVPCRVRFLFRYSDGAL